MATDGTAEGSHHIFLIVMHELFGTKHTLDEGKQYAVGIRSAVKNLTRYGCFGQESLVSLPPPPESAATLSGGIP